MRFDAFPLRGAIDAMWLGRVTYADGLKQQRYYVDKLLNLRKLASNSIKK